MALKIIISGEAETAMYWHKWLEPFGYTITQGFPTNIQGETSRITHPDGSVFQRAFSPTFTCFTFIHVETGIPLYTKTIGRSRDLVLWSGFLGIKDIIANRTPTKNPKLTNIRDRADTSAANELYYSSRALDEAEGNVKQNPKFTGEAPPDDWGRNMNVEEQENYLEQNFPEYHKFLIRELHRPIEAKDILSQLNATKSKADFVRKVMDITKQENPRQKVDEWALEHSKGHWVLTILANKKLQKQYPSMGFYELTPEYLDILLNSRDVPKRIKNKLAKTKDFELETSKYFIRAPQGEKIMKGNIEDDDWFRLIKNKDEDDWEIDETNIDPITGGMASMIATSLEEARGGFVSRDNRCCRNLKELLRDYLIHKHNLPSEAEEFVMSFPCDIIDKKFTATRDIEGQKTGNLLFNFYDELKEIRDDKGVNVLTKVTEAMNWDRATRTKIWTRLNYNISINEENIADGIKTGAFTVYSGFADLVDKREGKVPVSPKDYWNMSEAIQHPQTGKVIKPATYGASFMQYYADCKKENIRNPRMMTYQAATDENIRELNEDIALTPMEHNKLKLKLLDKLALKYGLNAKTDQPQLKAVLQNKDNQEYYNLYTQKYEELAADGITTLLELTESEDLLHDIANFLNQDRDENKKIIYDRTNMEWGIKNLELSKKPRLLEKDPDDDDKSGGLA